MFSLLDPNVFRKTSNNISIVFNSHKTFRYQLLLVTYILAAHQCRWIEISIMRACASFGRVSVFGKKNNFIHYAPVNGQFVEWILFPRWLIGPRSFFAAFLYFVGSLLFARVNNLLYCSPWQVKYPSGRSSFSVVFIIKSFSKIKNTKIALVKGGRKE